MTDRNDEPTPSRPTFDDVMGRFGELSLGGALARLARAGRKSGIAMPPAMSPQVPTADQIEATIDRATGAIGMFQMMPVDGEIRERYLNPPNLCVTDSVPAVEAMVTAWRASGYLLIVVEADRWAKGSPERYTIELLGPRGALLDHLDTVRWLREVANRRWLAQHPTDGYDDAAWWTIWRGVLRLRWTLNGRRGPLPGYLPSREVALREPGPLVGGPS